MARQFYEVPTWTVSCDGMVMASDAFVPLDEVSRIEKGIWSDAYQDWRSVLVFRDDTRLQTAWWYKDAAAKVTQMSAPPAARSEKT